MKQKTLKGKLELFYEQGLEGTAWAFYEDGKQGYDALHSLRKGDILTIFNKAGRKMWKGKINFDGELQKIRSFGYAYGMQKRIAMKKWIKMFKDERRAELIIASPPKMKGKP